MVFGRDIKQMPCFRDSALHGIYAGLASLLITLMATSRPSLAADVGVGMLCATVTGSFILCRYQRHKTSKLFEEINDIRKESIISENKVDEA